MFFFDKKVAKSGKYAANYKLTFIRTHTAATDGEQVTYIDDDFNSIPYAKEDPKGTVQTPDFVLTSPMRHPKRLNSQKEALATAV